ncbi:MAG: glycosyltransferase family 4 protein [Anaerolineae bacterium]|nr:glycosyltransferase family 4 protein [Anaerolineae bacterium]
MPTCLVNLAHLDPPQVGGLSRIAREVSRLLLERSDIRTVFAVNATFAPAFMDWISQPAIVIPYIGRSNPSWILSLCQPDLIVSPLFGLHPFTSDHALRAAHIVSIPDALSLDMPDLFAPADRAYRQGVYAMLIHARRVVTLSEHARGRLLHHLPLKPEQVRVVPLGSDATAADDSHPPLNDLPAHYVLYPANLWPHKRHDLLLRTMHLVWRQQPDLHLVLTGGGRSADQVTRLMDVLSETDRGRVHDLGFVEDARLDALYRRAEALVFTSRYEGFGMPLVEAMRNDCPVICAPLTSIPEVVGDAALFVQSDEPADWARAICDELPARRAELIAAGRARAEHFTWARARQGWDAALREVLPESTPLPSQTTQIADSLRPLLNQIADARLGELRFAERAPSPGLRRPFQLAYRLSRLPTIRSAQTQIRHLIRSFLA